MVTSMEAAEKLRLPTAQPAHVTLAVALRRQILVGSFPVGTRLPAERDLAPALGVSRNTARQAIKILADQGLVKTTLGRNGGSIVTEPPLPLRNRGAVLARWRATFEDSYALRLTLQPLASRWAAERATVAQRRSILKLSQPVATNIFEAQAHEASWLGEVVAAARQPMLLEALTLIGDALFDELNLLWILTDIDRAGAVSLEDWRLWSMQRRAISVAISNGDVHQAEEATTAHLNESLAYYFSTLEAMTAEPDTRQTAPRGRAG